MKKFVIPIILTATILIAGIFALMPVERVSTVHTTILGDHLTLMISTASTNIFGEGDIVCTSTAAFLVHYNVAGLADGQTVTLTLGAVTVTYTLSIDVVGAGFIGFDGLAGTLAGSPDETFTIASSGGSANAIVSLQTKSGATASCA